MRSTSLAMRNIVFCLLILLLPLAARAEIVYQEVRPGISASAEYQRGDAHKPAVLLVHGFLQTREFSTVATLAHGLRDAGYTVLTPTLSLNIPRREKSLACEAVHRHSLDEDVAEIARWVGWLKSRGHTSIVAVGHSFGSLQLLAYLDGRPDPAVKAYIGASLIETKIADVARPTVIARLEERVRAGQRELITQPLSFCRNYTSTPRDLLSYVRWDQARLLRAVKRVPVPIRLIMGDADTMLGRDMIGALRHVQAPLVVVRGANHFMDGQHEFDLLEHTLEFLQSLQAPQP